MHIHTIHRHVAQSKGIPAGCMDAQTFLNYVHFRFTGRGSIMSKLCTNYVPWIKKNKQTNKRANKKNTPCFSIEPTITIGLTIGQFKKRNVTYIMGKALCNLPLIHPFTHNHWWQWSCSGLPKDDGHLDGRCQGSKPPTLWSVDDQIFTIPYCTYSTLMCKISGVQLGLEHTVTKRTARKCEAVINEASRFGISAE